MVEATAPMIDVFSSVTRFVVPTTSADGLVARATVLETSAKGLITKVVVLAIGADSSMARDTFLATSARGLMTKVTIPITNTGSLVAKDTVQLSVLAIWSPKTPLLLRSSKPLFLSPVLVEPSIFVVCLKKFTYHAYKHQKIFYCKSFTCKRFYFKTN